MTTAACYVRVSTDEQSIENQRRELAEFVETRGWEAEWFEDEGLSGSRSDRPGYQALIEAARKGKVDVVVVWKLDRLGRSLSQLVQDAERLQEWGVDLVTYEQQIDTSSTWGPLQLAVFSALAEVEASIISSRTKAAYERKKEQGEADGWGRPKAEVGRELLAKVAAGELTQKEAAEQAGVSARTIRRRLDEFEEKVAA